MALPFEQQKGETNKAFAAFSLYLSMGPQRSTEAVAKTFAKSQQLIRRWSARWDWTARVAAYDAHMARVEREAAEAIVRAKGVDWVTRQEEHRAEEWKIRGELIEIARIAIERWKANKRRVGSLEGIGRLLELASKLGRLASGMPTDRTEVTGEGGGPIMIEFEASLKKVYGKRNSVVVDVEATPEEPAALPAPP